MTEPHRVLIVDDQRASRVELAEMVESLGYRALTAESGLEGIRLAREARPSLVLLDLVMPDVDGFKVASAIKAQPRFVPVILLTAHSDIESKRRGQMAGADDFLSKPVMLPELQIRIAAMLRIGQLTAELDAANCRLAELAHTDPLTGLANRRRFDELFSAEYDRARRYRRPLAVLSIDIDLFKQVNDTSGHAVGDEVLRAVASALLGALRQTDQIARTGGEEFVVLAPESTVAGALALGERLRRRIEALAMATSAGEISKTVSIGAATWDGAGTIDPSRLLQLSDEALYQAKDKGRNRVVLAVLRGEPAK